ncbi:TonB-dependent receptor [Sphingomonas sp.]|uniref:TonB-dependent receptor n=1 Tax=Sphingomonas sp. TaxID=28214 RepID=UPI003D6D7167
MTYKSYRLAALAPLLIPGSAFAQTTLPVAPTLSAQDNPDELSDIVVTAQKRSENLQRVPISVTAVTAEKLAATGAISTQDLTQAVPGLVIGKSLSSSQTYLRGVGQGIGSLGAESPVATYVDGIYLGAPSSGIFDLNNIAQISVLRGPQGTLFGRNATGGMIQVTTRDPSWTTAGSAEIGYGNLDTLTGRFYVTGPLSDTLAANLSVSARKRFDGYILNKYTGNKIGEERSLTGQAKLLWKPGPDTQVLLNVILSDEDGADYLVRGIIPGFIGTDGVTTYSGARTVNTRIDPSGSTNSDIASLKVTQDLGGVRLSSQTSYIHFRGDYRYESNGIVGTPNPTGFKAQIVTPPGTIDSVTQELQIQSPEGQDFQWIAGAFYLHDVTKLHLTVRPETTISTDLRSRLTTASYSAFGQATKTILPGTRLTVGLRYTRDVRDLDAATAAGVTPQSLGLPTHKVFPKVTWRLALDHDFGPDILGYATYNRGFKSGTFNTTSVSNPPIQPERIDAYEIGLKTQLFDRRVRINIAGFYYDYKDIQLRAVQGGPIVVYNAAQSRIYGADIDFSARLMHGLTLSGGAELLSASYRNFPGGIFAAPNPVTSIPTNCTGAVNTKIGGTTNLTCNLSGNRMIRAPKFTGNLNLNYETRTSWGKLEFNVGDSYNSGYFFEPDNFLKQKSYNWMTASISTSFGRDDRFSVRLWGTNLLNENVYDLATASGSLIFVPGMPRTYGATIGVTF